MGAARGRLASTQEPEGDGRTVATSRALAALRDRDGAAAPRFLPAVDALDRFLALEEAEDDGDLYAAADDEPSSLPSSPRGGGGDRRGADSDDESDDDLEAWAPLEAS